MQIEKSKLKAKIIITLFCLLWFLILGRLFYLQLIKSKEISKYTKEKQLRLLSLEARRGDILDRNGRILATDLKMFTLYAKKGSIKNLEETATKLSYHNLGKKEELLSLLKSNSEFIKIARGIPDSTIEKINIPGIYAVKEWFRFYPSKSLGRSFLGALNWERKGIAGVESEYNEFLKGKDGWAYFLEVPRSSGISLLKRYEFGHKEPVKGYDIYLTIDLPIQYIINEELEKLKERTNAAQVMGICVSVKTGEIFGMVNIPEFNPENGWKLNSCISWEFEPGSIFKLIPALAYIKEGLPIKDTIVDTSIIKFAGKTFKDVHPHSAYTFRESIIYSSNVGFITIGEKIGKKAFYNTARLMGIGCKTGVDLPAEYPGRLPNLPKEKNIQLATMSFGQGVSATPLQMVMIYQAIGNNGILLKPRIMKAIGKEGKIIKRSKKEEIRKIAYPEECKILLDILHEVTIEGTGSTAYLSLLPIAGKTGTAWKVKDGNYVKGRYVSSFIGLFPYPDPEFVLGIFIDDIGTPYYASETACPAFKEIVKRIILYKGYRENLL